MRNFRKLKIWKRSFEFVKAFYVIFNQIPAVEEFGLKIQMKRAAVSIPSNIAEGCGRNSDAELIRYLNIAQGFAFELETQLLLGRIYSISLKLKNYCLKWMISKK